MQDFVRAKVKYSEFSDADKMYLVELFVTHTTTLNRMYSVIFTETQDPERQHASMISRQSSTDVLIRDYLRDLPLDDGVTPDKRISSIQSVVSTQSDTDMRTNHEIRSMYNASHLAGRTNNQSREMILTNEEASNLKANRNASLSKLTSIPPLGLADMVQKANLASNLPLQQAS